MKLMTPFQKTLYDNLQRKLAKVSKERRAADAAGNPWKIGHPGERAYWDLKAKIAKFDR